MNENNDHKNQQQSQEQSKEPVGESASNHSTKAGNLARKAIESAEKGIQQASEAFKNVGGTAGIKSKVASVASEAKNKYEAADGMKGIKGRGGNIISQIKNGFSPDEEKTSYKKFFSRFKNLWKSGIPGKAVLLFVAAILLLFAFSGNDEKRAREYLAKGLELGKNGQVKEGAEYIFKSAELGNSDAQFRLYAGYKKGDIGEKNMEKAIFWLKKSVEQGNDKAQFDYGTLYMAGDGVEKSYSKASKLFEPAARQGHTGAMYNLAIIYRKGDGEIEKDLTKSMGWALLASSLNFSRANGIVDMNRNNMSNSELEEAQAFAETEYEDLMAYAKKLQASAKADGDKASKSDTSGMRFDEIGVSFGLPLNKAKRALKSYFVGQRCVVMPMKSEGKDLCVIGEGNSVFARVYADEGSGINRVNMDPGLFNYDMPDGVKDALLNKYNMKEVSPYTLENDEMTVVIPTQLGEWIKFTKK